MWLTGQPEPQSFSQPTASPTQGDQGQHRPQLGGHQHAPEPVLQLGDGLGTGLAGLLKLTHPAGTQPDEGEFPSREEGQHGQQNGQSQDLDHGETPPGEPSLVRG